MSFHFIIYTVIITPHFAKLVATKVDIGGKDYFQETATNDFGPSRDRTATVDDVKKPPHSIDRIDHLNIGQPLQHLSLDDSVAMLHYQRRLAYADEDAANIRAKAEAERRTMLRDAQTQVDGILARAREMAERERSDTLARIQTEGDTIKAKANAEAERVRANAEAEIRSLHREAAMSAEAVCNKAKQEAAAITAEAERSATSSRDKLKLEMDKERADHDAALASDRRSQQAKLDRKYQSAKDQAEQIVDDARAEAARMRSESQRESMRITKQAEAQRGKAEEEAEERKAAAIREAKQLLRDARTEAEKIAADARAEGTRDAERQVNELEMDISRLEQKKQKLLAEICTLEDERTTLSDELCTRRSQAFAALEEELQRQRDSIVDQEKVARKHASEIIENAKSDANEIRARIQEEEAQKHDQLKEKLTREESQMREVLAQRQQQEEEALNQLRGRLEKERQDALASMEADLEKERVSFRERLQVQREHEETIMREDLARQKQRLEEELTLLEADSKRALTRLEEGQHALSVHEETKNVRKERDDAVRAKQVAEIRASELEDVVEDLKYENNSMRASLRRFEDETEEQHTTVQQLRFDLKQAEQRYHQMEDAYERLQTSLHEQEQQTQINTQRQRQDREELERVEEELQQARRNHVMYEAAARDLELQLQEARVIIQRDQERIQAEQHAESQLQESLQDVIRTNTGLKQKIISLEELVTELQNDISSRDLEIAQAKRRISSHERGVHDLELKVVRLTDEMSDAQQALSNVQGQLQVKEEAYQRALTRQATLERDLDEAHKRLSGENLSSSRLTVSIQRIQDELQEERKQHEAMKLTRIEEKRLYDEEITHLHTQLKAAEERASAVAKEREEFVSNYSKENTDELAKTRHNFFDLQAECAEWKERAAALQRTIDRMTQQHASNSSNDSNQSDEQEKVDLSDSFDPKGGHRNIYEERRRNEELAQNIDALQRRETQLILENQQFQRKMQDMEKSLQNLTTDLEKETAMLRSSREKANTAEALVHTLRQETTRLEHRLDARNSELEDATKQIEELRLNIRNLKHKDSQQKSHGMSSKAVGYIDATGDDYEVITRLTAQLQRHEHHLVSVREEHARALERLEGLQQQHLAKEKRVHDINTRMQQLVDEVEVSARKAVRLQHRNDKIDDGECKATNNGYSTAENQVKSKRKDRQKDLIGITTAPSEIDALLKRLKEMSALKDTLTEELHHTYNSYDQLRSIVSEQKATMEALRNQLRQRESDIEHERARGDNLLRIWDISSSIKPDKQSFVGMKSEKQDNSPYILDRSGLAKQKAAVNTLRQQFAQLQSEKESLQDEFDQMHQDADVSLLSRTQPNTSLLPEVRNVKQNTHDISSHSLDSFAVEGNTQRQQMNSSRIQPKSRGNDQSTQLLHESSLSQRAMHHPTDDSIGFGDDLQPASRLGLSDLEVVIEN